MTGAAALVVREVHRFLKIWADTVVTPVASTVFFMLVFSVVGQPGVSGGAPYLPFVYAGLLAMNVATGSFSNPAFSLVISKNIGSFIDIKLAPMRPFFVGLAYGFSGLIRAAVILALTIACTAWAVPGFGVAHPLIAAGAFILCGLQFSWAGVIFGCLTNRFEALPFVLGFILQPMVFLGGVFYAISVLPEPWQTVSLFNPMHHSINLIRFGLTGQADTDIMLSLLVGLALLVPLSIFMHFTVKKILTT